MPQNQTLGQTNQQNEATLVFKINFYLAFPQRKIYVLVKDILQVFWIHIYHFHVGGKQFYL